MSGTGRPLISLLTVQTMRFSTSLWRHFLSTPSALGGATMASASKSLRSARSFSSSAASLIQRSSSCCWKSGLLIGRAAIAGALLDRSGRVRLDLAVLAVFPLVVRLGPEIDLILVAMIAEEQHLAAVGDQNQRIVGKGHGRFLLWCSKENAVPS